VKVVTSRGNSFFKQLLKLTDSASRRRLEGLTVLDGSHLIEAYRAAIGLPRGLIVSESGLENGEIKFLLRRMGIEGAPPPTVFGDALFREISPLKNPSGVMALIAVPAHAAIRVHPGPDFRVLLEAIQDPGNIGSILRSAAAAGVQDAYLSAGCADMWSPKALRTAMGAHFRLRIHEHADLIQVAREFDGTVFATTLSAKKSLYAAKLTGPVAFAFGNEGAGLSRELLKAVDEQILIPMPGKMESLNAAAAAAACFFERVRQLQA